MDKVFKLFLFIISLASILVGCAQNLSEKKPNPLHLSIAEVIAPGLAGYDITYRENHSKKLKQAIIVYETKNVVPCLIAIHEKIKIIDLYQKQAKHYVNTYQLSLASIDPQSVKVRQEAYQGKNKISLSAGELLHHYILSLHYSQKDHALIPYTGLSISGYAIDSSQVKLLNQMAIRFAHKGSALLARKVLLHQAKQCSKAPLSRDSKELEQIPSLPTGFEGL